jgi:hypothetical protein
MASNETEKKAIEGGCHCGYVPKISPSYLHAEPA